MQTSQRSSSELSPQPSTPLHKIALDLHLPFRQVNADLGHSAGSSSFGRKRRAERPSPWAECCFRASCRPLFSGVRAAKLSAASILFMASRSALTRGELAAAAAAAWTGPEVGADSVTGGGGGGNAVVVATVV